MGNEKGISIITLIITVVVMLILSTTLITSSRNSPNVQNFNKMDADIKILEDKIAIYYNKYGQIPINQETIEKDQIADEIKDKDMRRWKLLYDRFK